MARDGISRSCASRSGFESSRLIAFVSLLIVLTLATPFPPPQRDGMEFAWQALAGYVVLAASAWWLDRAAR
jgi:hypothetical protein